MQGLSPDAAKVVRILLRSGPQTTVVLREALDAVGSGGGARFEASVRELGRALVVTNHGTREERPGWPSAVLESLVDLGEAVWAGPAYVLPTLTG